MNFVKQVYKILETECGDKKNIKGADTTTLANMKKGKMKGMNTTTLSRIFKENNMNCEFLIVTPSGEEKKVEL